MQQELAVAFHAPDGGVDQGEGLTAVGANGVFHAMEGQLVGGECTDQRSCGVDQAPPPKRNIPVTKGSAAATPEPGRSPRGGAGAAAAPEPNNR